LLGKKGASNVLRCRFSIWLFRIRSGLEDAIYGGKQFFYRGTVSFEVLDRLVNESFMRVLAIKFRLENGTWVA
jgi:hypothetical protein